MGLSDIFAKLKTSIVGVNTQHIDSTLDNIVKDVSAYRSQTGSNNYIEIIKRIASSSNPDLSNIFGATSSANNPISLGQGSRLVRYKAYDSILSNIDYCKRALDVLVDNILSPDDITKISLDVKSSSIVNDITENGSSTDDIKEVIKKLKLENSLEHIVKNTLQDGDYFCEIADQKTRLVSRSSILSEGMFINNDSCEQIFNEEVILESLDGRERNSNLKIIMDYTSVEEEERPSKNNKKVEDLALLFYEPRRVVKLQSELYPICFGYLVFPTAALNPSLMLQNQIIDNLCNTILSSVAKKLHSEELNNDINKDDLKNIIQYVLRENNVSKAMNVRFVPESKMVHFHLMDQKYNPYGRSIFDYCQFSAKLLIVLQTVLAIARINRSVEKRKILIELGLPRDAGSLIEKMKEELRKRKVSFDSMGTIDTIACLKLDTKIKLTNGKSLSLDEIINFVNQEKELEVYAYDHSSGKIRPDRIKNAKITGKNVNVIKVTLDNEKSVICTPEHLWMMRDGTYKRADELKENDSLMPIYTRDTKNSTNSWIKYEQIYQPGVTRGRRWETCGSKSCGQKIMHNTDYGYLNHKVKKVEVLIERVDVGDIETEKFHNFALDSGVFVHNSSITTFEDIFIPQKDGKPFVDIQTFNEGNMDTRGKVEEIKLIRDQIVGGLGVPASYIGVEENVSSKATLSEESLLFARTIVKYQKIFSEQITWVIKKVFDIIDPEKALELLDNNTISFPSPKSLQFERESKYLSDLANMIRTLEEIGIPREWAKKKYLTSIDWDEVEKYEIKTKIDKSLGLNVASDPSMGGGMDTMGMGGMGGMGGGMPGGGMI